MSQKRYRYCCINGCINFLGTKSDDFNFFRMPKDEQTRKDWLEQISKHQEMHKIASHSALCNIHFASDCFIEQRKLAPDAKPSIFPMKNPLPTDERNEFHHFHTFCPSNNNNIPQDIPQNVNRAIQTELEKKLLDHIISLEKDLHAAKKEIDNLKEKYSNKIKKLEKMKSSFSALKVEEKRRLKNEEKSGLDKDSLEILKCLEIGRKNTQTYSEVIRSFSITLHFYSPRAYKFVRDKFNKHLPNETTIRKWYANCTQECQPGMNKEGMRALASVSNDFKNENKQLIVSIAFDEMAIRRLVQWSEAKKIFLGYITYGSFNADIPVARNAIVFLATALNADFSIPIAHHFVVSLKKIELATLLKEIIAKITSLGVRVACVTFDGLRTNLAACEFLGASLKSHNTKPFILNPVDSTKIHIFIDACHVLKLARNLIASEEYLYNRSNNTMVSWIFFRRLEAHRIKNDFIRHKLTKKHIQWFRAKMDVRLASETMSRSVANSMAHLMNEGVKNFQHSQGTIEYIQFVDTFFDIFNSKNEKSSNVFKSPITIASKERIFEFLKETDTYIRSLTLNGRSVLISKKNTAFKAMLINIMSLKNIVSDYLDSGLIENVATFRLSQDPLETLFGRLRSLNGNNNNPSVEQFTSALRKMLVHNEIMSSDLSNCTDQLKILTISSFKLKESEICNHELSDGEADEIDSIINDRFCPNDYLQNVFQDSTVIRMANDIENKIQFIARFECENCMDVLTNNPKISSRTHTYTPCLSTVLIGKIVYKFFNIFKNERTISYEILFETILRNIDKDNVFSIFHCENEHKEYFINFIVKEFIRMRAVYIAKTSTLNEQKRMLRKQLNKAVHFRGQ